MTTHDPSANRVVPAPGRKLEPWVMVLATAQFILTFAGAFCRYHDLPLAGMLLTYIPIGTTFIGSLVLCSIYTQECRCLNPGHTPLANYLIGIAAAALLAAAVFLAATLLIGILPRF